MEISRPQYNHIRFETDKSLLSGLTTVNCQAGFHPIVVPPSDEFDKFMLGARCTFTFFDGTLLKQVSTYLGEVLSVIEGGSTPQNDLNRLRHLAIDFHNGFKQYFKSQAPYLGVEHSPIPDFEEFLQDWVRILSEQGFY